MFSYREDNDFPRFSVAPVGTRHFPFSSGAGEGINEMKIQGTIRFFHSHFGFVGEVIRVAIIALPGSFEQVVRLVPPEWNFFMYS